MNVYRWLRDAVHRGGTLGRFADSHARALRGRALALVGVAILSVATVESCKVTRNADQSYTIEFAPDMTITAWGLEDALRKLSNLFVDCITGVFPRRCTQDELDAIEHMMDKIVGQKRLLEQQ